MNKLWRVAAYEYRRNVFKKSFIFTLLSIPFFIAFSIGIGLFMESLGNKSQPIGIVDRAGILSEPLVPPEIQSDWAAQYRQPIEFIAFQSEQVAQDALAFTESVASIHCHKCYIKGR